MPASPRPSGHRHRRATTGLALATALLAAPAAASAADAPLRTIGVTPAGDATTTQYPVAVSPDGRLVLSNDRTTVGRPQPLLRDVAAGTTTKLLAEGDVVIDASTDLGRILFSTTRKASAKDLDATDDLYVFDRASGQTTLVSQDPISGKLGEPADEEAFGDEHISGDGNAVVFHSTETTFNTEFEGGPVKEVNRQWRFDLAAGTLAQLATWGNAVPGLVRQLSVDDAGRVTVNVTGIDVAGKKLPLPFSASNAFARSHVSADGSTVLFEVGGNLGVFTLVNTATGAVSTIKVPSSIASIRTTRGALDGGGGAVISYPVTRSAGTREIVGTVSKAGTLTQVGGDITTTAGSNLWTVSRNLQFAATSLHLAQLGTTPLPGTEPNPTGPAPDALKYIYVQDVYCNRNLFGFSTWVRAKASLVNLAIGTDTRLPKTSEWKVYDTVTKKVINHFTLAAGKSRDLTVPRTGGWTYDVKVTLSDGAVITGTGKVDPHPTPACLGITL